MRLLKYTWFPDVTLVTAWSSFGPNKVERLLKSENKHLLYDRSVEFVMIQARAVQLSRVFYIANVLKPPSTTATVPVTNFEASLMR